MRSVICERQFHSADYVVNEICCLLEPNAVNVPVWL